MNEYMIRFAHERDGLATGGMLFTIEHVLHLANQYDNIYLSVDGLTPELATKFAYNSRPLPGYWNSSRLLKFVQCWVHYTQMGEKFNWIEQVEVHDWLFTHYND